MKQSKHKALRLFINILRTQSKAALHKKLVTVDEMLSHRPTITSQKMTISAKAPLDRLRGCHLPDLRDPGQHPRCHRNAQCHARSHPRRLDHRGRDRGLHRPGDRKTSKAAVRKMPPNRGSGASAIFRNLPVACRLGPGRGGGSRRAWYTGLQKPAHCADIPTCSPGWG